MASVDAILFDVDGTLVDSVDLHAEAWARAFEKFGKPVPAMQVRKHIGRGGDQLMPEFLSEAEMKKFSDELDQYRSDLWKREYLDRVTPFPKVRELFLALRERHLRIALGSSGKKNEIEAYVERLAIGDLIESFTTSDDAERSKPYPDIFQGAMKKLGSLNPTQAAVVGDSPFDLQAAKRGNFPAIGFLCGGFVDAELRAEGASEIYRDPEDFLARLDHSMIVR